MRIEQYATTLTNNTITGSTWVSTERYYYDSANRATRIIRQDADGDSYECRWEYDHNNNVTNLVEIVNGQTHTTAYTYDLDQRISQLTADGTTSVYAYDGFGRLNSVSNGVLTRGYGYRAVGNYTTGQVATLELNRNGSGYRKTYTYTYDANGNIVSVNDGTNTTTYTYDNLNQLVREENQAAGKTWVYAYDNGGNIIAKTAYRYSTEQIPAVLLSPPVTYTYNDPHWGDLLTAYNGQTITYDGIGNPLNDGTWTYTWENSRQLASMTSGTTTWSYKYNADGLRTERTNGNITYDYIYSGSQLIQMTVGSNVLYFTYDAAGTPMTVTFNGTKYFYVTNLQGDIIAILDTNGNAVVEYTYDAWGNILTATESTLGNLNPLRYRGYVYDSETKFYYLQSRYYDPELGRFINADSYASTGQGVLGNNMFAYCLNNPVVLVDSSGNAAHIGFSHDGQPHYAPWKIGSPGGGGWSQDIHYHKQDYGSVADKFYTVRAARFVGNRFAHSATKWWGAYVCFVERTSDFCLQRNISMYHIGHDLIGSVDRLEDFHGIIAGGVGASRLLANVAVGAPVIIYGEIVCPPVAGAALAVGAVVVSIVKIVKYFRSIPVLEE